MWFVIKFNIYINSNLMDSVMEHDLNKMWFFSNNFY